MSVQIFLQGKVFGGSEFLLSSPTDFEGRAHWVTLLSEVLPRALLAELGLSRMLLGASGGDQFLLLLPSEFRDQAESFCKAAADDIARRSGGFVRFIWSLTENLGAWTDVRKRLLDDVQQRGNAPVNLSSGPVFGLTGTPPSMADNFGALAKVVMEVGVIGWSPERPGAIEAEGKHTWTLGSADGISYARHTALQNNDRGVASLATLGSRASGRRRWAVLLGNVDGFATRLQRATSIEEHIQLSIMFKQFFAGELQMLCSQPDFFQRVSLLYTGGNDFAVFGAWNSCIGLAREVQRLFQQFVETNLKDSLGTEGKTISMSLALAEHSHSSLVEVWGAALEKLDVAKASGKDGIYLLGRTLEWKQLTAAAETKAIMSRMIKEFGCSPQFLNELGDFYRDSASIATPGARKRNDRLDRPWRFHRRLNGVIASSRNREFQRLRTELIADFTGRRASQIRLRPQGRVALEWAKLETSV